MRLLLKFAVALSFPNAKHWGVSRGSVKRTVVQGE